MKTQSGDTSPHSIIYMVVFALLAAGCGTTGETASYAEKSYFPSPLVRQHVVTDASMPVKVARLTETTNPENGCIKITVALKNFRASPQTAFYYCEWYDHNGLIASPAMSPSENWSSIELAGHESFQVIFNAPYRFARDYKIKLFEEVEGRNQK